MAAGAACKIPALHNACKTPSLGPPRYIHKFAHLEYAVACYLLPHLIAVQRLSFKLLQVIKTRRIPLCKVAGEGLVYAFFLLLYKAELNRIIALFAPILFLDHKTRACLYYRNRDYLPLLIKYLGHPELFP